MRDYIADERIDELERRFEAKERRDAKTIEALADEFRKLTERLDNLDPSGSSKNVQEEPR